MSKQAKPMSPTLLSDDATHALDYFDDEPLARYSTAALLITASTADEVAIIARRIHQSSERAAAAFVVVSAAALPVEPRMLGLQCSTLQEAACGGSMLLSGIEDAPVFVQAVLVELLTEARTGLGSARGVRLIAGTTVSLVDRVAQGTFSERLLYRLNVIHLVVAKDLAGSMS